MTDQFTGILPYGSSDSSVLLQCSLKSQAEVLSAGGTEPNAASNSYDSLRGLKATATNGGVRFSTIAGYEALANAGQISFEIETAAICVTNAAVPSVGTNWAGNAYAMVVKNAAGTNFFRYYHDSNERAQFGWTTGGGAGGTSPGSTPIELTSLGKGEFTRMTFSWIGNQCSWFVNDAWLFTGLRNGITTDLAERIEIMSSAGLGSCMTETYARNLIVSSRPVMFPTHHQLGSVAFVGHSFVTRCTMRTFNQTYRDQSISQMTRARLFERGVGCNMPNDDSLMFPSSGATILHSGGSPISTQVALCAAANPDSVVYIGGTNDVINAAWLSNRAQVLVDLKDDLSTLLAATNTKRVVVANVMSVRGNAANYASAKRDLYVQQINADIATLPDWWDSANPARAGAVAIANNFDATGGLSPPVNLIQGLVLNSGTDLHPSSAANVILGRQYADTLISMLK